MFLQLLDLSRMGEDKFEIKSRFKYKLYKSNDDKYLVKTNEFRVHIQSAHPERLVTLKLNNPCQAVAVEANTTPSQRMQYTIIIDDNIREVI